MSEVIIYTDGACRGNPGPGGWGAVLAYGNKKKELFGSERETTNNRMELLAAIKALDSLKWSCKVSLYTDSQYVRKGILEWMDNWKKRGWKTSARKPVKNQDLWISLDKALTRHDVEWHWVKGHSGVAGNEHADSLANQAIDELLNADK
ncbi:MAG: ribonuclease HI [Arenicellales bacterium]|jgi:ribonuclease HI